MLIKPLTREALFINKTDIQAGKIKCFHASNLLIYCINNEGQKGQGKEGEIKTHPGQSPCCDTPAPPRDLEKPPLKLVRLHKDTWEPGRAVWVTRKRFR